MSTVENILKDVGEIHGRLFDHRPFLQGEINYFLKEFETKRNDSEVQQLFEILENVTEIKETQIDKACWLGDAHLCGVTSNLEVALSMCNKILERSTQNNTNELLKARREKREQEWQEFVASNHDKSEKVDKAFANRSKELMDHYSELEVKMCASISAVNKSP